jgi:hypothetical protein
MKINFLLAVVFISIIIYANVNYEDGIVGHTKRDGNPGCLCHSLTPTDSAIVWIEGPDSVFVGDSVHYKILMTGGPAIAGGFDLASYFGVLDSTDTLTHIISGELTHTQPNLFSDDTVKWNFLYIAPDSLVTDTLYSVGNSVNLDGIPSDLDQWNFGENFIIHVLDVLVNVEKENLLPDGFVLSQNYPNPFNPTTTLPFVIGHLSFVTLNVYDVLGKEVATLVNEEKSQGEYEVEFSGAGLTSGIYFYRLEVITPNNSIIETRKMVLLR